MLLSLSLLLSSFSLLSSVIVEPYSIPNCNNIPPSTDTCYYRIIYDPSRCSAESPCTQLLIYWSGGEQSVKDGNYDPLMASWARRGYVAVAAQPYDSGLTTGDYPVNWDQERLSFITQKVRQNVSSLWTGERFVVSGVSYGASSPPMSIANGNLFNTQPDVWTGSEATAVVLFDGFTDSAKWEEWSSGQVEVDSNCKMFHSYAAGRYQDGTPLAHSCRNKKCYCSDPPHASLWSNDSIVIGETYPPSPYTCGNFLPKKGLILYRIVSCEGQGNLPCDKEGDVIPTDQQSSFYSAVSQCGNVNPNLVTSYQVFPKCGHSSCGTLLCGGNDAIEWLSSQWNGTEYRSPSLPLFPFLILTNSLSCGLLKALMDRS